MKKYLRNFTFRIKRIPKKETGFTIIELIVAVSLVGTLSAIALPQYSLYRSRGFDADAQYALRSVAVAEESFFLDHGEYATCDQSTCHLILPNLRPLTSGIELQMVSSVDDFSGTSWHIKGTGRVFSWN